MDLYHLNLPQLHTLALKIKLEIQHRQHNAISLARQQIITIAKDSGFALKDLIAAVGKGHAQSLGAPVRTPVRAQIGTRKGIKVPVRFRHPEHAALAWTGRGRQSKWVVGWIADGGTMAQLLVDGLPVTSNRT